jgi:hypothetical protein
VRILLDECVHAGVKAAFPGHEVRTVSEIGRQSSSDPALLDAAEAFDVFVTVDRKLPFQNRIDNRRFGVVLVRVPSNRIEAYRPLFPALLKCVESITPGELAEV